MGILAEFLKRQRPSTFYYVKGAIERTFENVSVSDKDSQFLGVLLMQPISNTLATH